MYKDVTDKFKEDSMMCAGGADRDACQVNLKSSENYGTNGIIIHVFSIIHEVHLLSHRL